ncbi:hypothetical protein [Veillonella sp. VA142]|uniref:hypothetical protein n=1 Tax=Veillonella sp. VA142 TaxID=741834 RepID=UPI000F8EE4BD|nr:hypothetical protein [Veillonella sp. VA142]
MARTGRPTIKIDKDNFEKLCGLQCTLVEIAGFFNCSEDTIQRWCKRTYKMTFAETYKTYSQQGKIALRRYQMKLAEKSAAMAIFLGKQLLSQRDYSEVEVKADINNPFDGVTTEDIKKLIGDE